MLALSCLMLLSHPTGSMPAQEPVQHLALSECSLELTASWETLTDTVYGFEKRYPLIRDLAPAVERVRYGADAFRPFLPSGAGAELGSIWRIDVERVLPLLRQFHPGATAELHHDGGFGFSAHGGWACLRVLGDVHAEVYFRVHAEFMLAGDGSRTASSWFTPGQFRGRLVIDRERGTVVAFELGVPPERANVDINVATDEGVSADIGRIPRMQLAGGEFPVYSPEAKQLGEREVQLLLERKFYPFAEIEWLDLPAARAASLATGKPLHVVALFGSLTDESC